MARDTSDREHLLADRYTVHSRRQAPPRRWDQTDVLRLDQRAEVYQLKRHKRKCAICPWVLNPTAALRSAHCIQSSRAVSWTVSSGPVSSLPWERVTTQMGHTQAGAPRFQKDIDN